MANSNVHVYCDIIISFQSIVTVKYFKSTFFQPLCKWFILWFVILLCILVYLIKIKFNNYKYYIALKQLDLSLCILSIINH